jgi:hypothetical protein
MSLVASFGAASSLGDALTKGELREEELVAALRPFLPARYGIVKGIVINADGIESDPQDLILYDTAVVPTVLGSGTTRIVPVEGVVAVLQLKSLATKATITHAISNLASAKALLPRRTRYSTAATAPIWQSTSASFFAGAVFLDSRLRSETIADRFADAVMAGDKCGRCDAFCVVEKMALLWGNPSDKPEGLHFAFRAEDAEAPLWLESGADSLLLFYLSLVEHLRNWISPAINWMEYVFGPDMLSTTMEFPYRYWYDDTKPSPQWVR